MGRPLALDLFCCQGGASAGLVRAGFRVVGVDLERQPRYPFGFVQADATRFPLLGFDLVWASPPCQRYSAATHPDYRHKHPDLIAVIRRRLRRAGVPYIIENVAGARRELVDPVMLCGSMFGLRSQRHRYFECSFPVSAPRACDHSLPPLLVTTAGASSRAIRKPGQYKSVLNAPRAYGISWMSAEGLKEAIPPAYAAHLARQARRHLGL